MAENTSSSALKVRQALDTEGRLNLWQVQAILGQSRDYSLGVLFRLSSESGIHLEWEDQRLLVTLNRAR